MMSNFKLITELQTLQRRDFELAVPGDLKPSASRPFIDGEWLEIDSNYKLARGGDNNAGSADEGTALAYPLFVEKGRYDTQAIRKTTVLMLGMYEAVTKVGSTSGLSLGDSLTVQDLTLSGSSIVRRGLKKKSGSSGGIVVVGIVTKVNTTTGEIRFVHTGYQVVY